MNKTYHLSKNYIKSQTELILAQSIDTYKIDNL
jgi:hypothetical protein